jgi:TolB-like protein/DNA-binding winged helix-turn-helix (wHTH) protein/cytochrome c-type biogenesis protein CcmH/NrfG
MGDNAPITKPNLPAFTLAERVRFDHFEVDFRSGELRKNGLKIKLHSQPLAVLEMLLQTPGEIVTREQLHQKLWGADTFVDFEQGLNKAINKLRDALSDTADSPRYIETLPRRGYRFIGTISPPKAAAPPAAPLPLPIPPKSKRSFASAVVVAGAILLVFAVWFGLRLRTAQTSHPARVMLAVLPFQNMSGDDNEDYFADGLTEEMIAQLGQLQPSSLGVIARTSAMRYKNTKESVAQIGKELGVNYLLEGSVRHASDRVRITAQLIQTDDQTHLWAESYETPLTDVLRIQREISERITQSLRLELLPAQRTAPDAHFDPEAYRKYLLGLNEFRKGTREGFDNAIHDFQDAIAIDPQNARPYAALAEVYSASVPYYSAPSVGVPLAKQAAQKALDHDPNLASAHVTLGDSHLLFDWDWTGADAEYRRALEINPNSPEAHLGYSNYLSTLGRHAEAVSQARQAYLFDPLALESRNESLWVYYFSGRLQETIEQAQKTIELEPQAGLPYALLALAYADLGQRAEASHAAERAAQLAENSPSVVATAASALARAGQPARAKQLLQHALDLAKNRYVCRFLVAGAYTDLGETEHALDSLELAFRQRST